MLLNCWTVVPISTPQDLAKLLRMISFPEVCDLRSCHSESSCFCFCYHAFCADLTKDGGMDSHDLWRRERKLIHKLTSTQASSTYAPLQEQEATHLMIDMLERPKAFWGHFQRYAGSVVMQIAFNKRAMTNFDPAVKEMVGTYLHLKTILSLHI